MAIIRPRIRQMAAEAQICIGWAWHSCVRRGFYAALGARWMRRVFRVGAACWIGFSLLDAMFPFRPAVAYSQVIETRDGTIAMAFLTPDDKWRMFATLEDITPQIREAFLAKEDKYFYYHPGVNLFAIARAMTNNLIMGRRTSGASTITMQTVRLLEPRPRTYVSKVIEMFRALQLETQLSKDEILQFYLNLVPYGGNIEGVKTAAWLYFQRQPEVLSLAQVVALTVIPNQPNTLRPGRNNHGIVKARNRWLARLGQMGVFSNAEVATAKAEAFRAERANAPRLAPHAGLRVNRAFPNAHILTLNLDAQQQLLAQSVVKQYVERVRPLGISNACAIVIHNPTRKVLAYVGSADFADPSAHGQVDGGLAVRSPGSALKPFIYALAMDAGHITPMSMLMDVPTNFTGYVPENFDNQFRGPVNAATALAQSLNIPAVRALQFVGVQNLVSALKRAGFVQMTEPGRTYGLSMALGGCGVRLTELANLFATLANGGIHQPIKWLATDTAAVSSQLVSAHAVYLVTNVLSSVKRPDLPFEYAHASSLPRIAWKTGTSHGRRDAWAVGYDPEITIGVWLGNFDGSGNPNIEGAGVATPLLFELFKALKADHTQAWFEAPVGLGRREVCSESGLVANHFCINRITDWYIPGVSSEGLCQHLKPIWISDDGRNTYCTNCLPQSGYRSARFPNLPPELVAFHQSRGMAMLLPPPHYPLCTRVLAGGKPNITSPTEGAELMLDRLRPSQVGLSCEPAPDARSISWFVNGRFVGQAAPNQTCFWKPDSGTKIITATDDLGRSASIRALVTFY